MMCIHDENNLKHFYVPFSVSGKDEEILKIAAAHIP